MPPTRTNESDQGNLPFSLEKQKLEALRSRIEQSAGVTPKVHKAGRYGFGWGTTEILKQLGFTVDVSPTPGFDLTSDGGPNHERVPNAPQWLDVDRELLAIPGTGSFVGLLRTYGPRLHRMVESPLGLRLHAGGNLSRLGCLERIRLSPEGFTLAEMKRLTRSLLGRGEKVFTLTYHSPSLALGCTPYVRDKQDLDTFLNRIEDFFAYFFGQLGGIPATPMELRKEIRDVEKARKI